MDNLVRKQTILVVDDAADNIFLLTDILSKKYRVKVASDGEKAIQIALETPPDLILLDVMMPKIDGYEVCRNLKKDLRTMHIPIIFITALKDVSNGHL